MLSREAASAGSGKTAIMREKMRSMDPDAMMCSTINLNSFSRCASSVQTILEQPLEKKSGGLPLCRCLILMAV